MKFSILFAAAATLAVAPAYADARPASRNSYQVRYDSRHDLYCLTDARHEVATGTRIPSVECRSAAEWAQQGLIMERRVR